MTDEFVKEKERISSVLEKLGLDPNSPGVFTVNGCRTASTTLFEALVEVLERSMNRTPPVLRYRPLTLTCEGKWGIEFFAFRNGEMIDFPMLPLLSNA